jgi:hypothetical protein
VEVKCLELRDKGTFIPVICIRPTPDNEAQRWLLRRDGYSGTDEEQCVILINAQCRGVSYDPYGWDSNTGHTIPYAHRYIREHWFDLQDGDVVDVEFVMGQSTAPKRSERETVDA